jgi:hypothetical protein
VFDHEGNHYDGASPAMHQASYDWRRGIGVSHTRYCNTGVIGMAVAAMHGAKDYPKLKWGSYPMTWEGIDAMLERVIEYSIEYDIPITPWSVMTHAEVQETLGIKQRAKWDIRCLPGDTEVSDARIVGDRLRERMTAVYEPDIKKESEDDVWNWYW